MAATVTVDGQTRSLKACGGDVDLAGIRRPRRLSHYAGRSDRGSVPGTVPNAGACASQRAIQTEGLYKIGMLAVATSTHKRRELRPGCHVRGVGGRTATQAKSGPMQPPTGDKSWDYPWEDEPVTCSRATITMQTYRAEYWKTPYVARLFQTLQATVRRACAIWWATWRSGQTKAWRSAIR